MSDIRILSTSQLLQAAYEGTMLGLNRQLDYSHVQRHADPNGFHVFSVILPFHEAYNKSLPAHHRVSGLIKLDNRIDGAEVIFDVTTENWNKYMNPEQFAERVKQLDGIELDLNVSANA